METADKISIAIIEDNTAMRISLRRFFESCNFTVILDAGNGQSAIDHFHLLGVLPDICVLDINMPVLDGFDTAELLSIKFPCVKILAFSSLDNSRSIKEMIMRGARGYLVKGCEPSELKYAVQILKEGGYFFSEKIRQKAQGFLSDKR